MEKNGNNISLDQICPIRDVISRIGNKWAILIVMVLDENDTTRFNQLYKMIPDISSKVLSATLRVLEADGIVERTVYAEVPPRVEYKLTGRGKSLVPIIHSLRDWALDNMEPIVQDRAEYGSARA